MKIGLKLAIFFAWLGCGFFAASYFIPARVQVIGDLTKADVTATVAPEQRLFFVGDVMLDRGVKYMVQKYGANDWHFPFELIAPFLRRADLVFANLEGPLSDQGIRAGSIYSFRMDPVALVGLQFANIGAVSLANNHALDYTRAALADTLTRLDQANIVHAGAGLDEQQAYQPVHLEINGLKIGLLAFTNLGPASWAASADRAGLAWIETAAQVVPFVQQAAANADVVIVSLHSGEEYKTEPTLFQRQFAEQATLAGADLIIQHHSHVIQPLERLELVNAQGSKFSAWVAYGLGNFVFDQGFSEATKRGRLLEVIVKDKKIEQVVSHDVEMNEFFQPQLAQ